MARSSATTKLDQLRQKAEAERATARDARAHAEAAQATTTTAREALIEAHAGNGDPGKCDRAHRQAQSKEESAAIKAEAAGRRADRAAQEAEAFEADHARDLIADLEPEAQAACEALEHAARTLHDAHQEWHRVNNRVGQLLRHVPGAHAAHDAPSVHELESAAREVRQFVRDGDGAITPPLPHYRGVLVHEAGQREARAAKEAAA